MNDCGTTRCHCGRNVAATLLVTSEKSPVVLVLLKTFCGYLWLSYSNFFDTFGDKVVPSEGLRDLLFAPLMISVLFNTFSLILAAAGGA